VVPDNYYDKNQSFEWQRAAAEGQDPHAKSLERMRYAVAWALLQTVPHEVLEHSRLLNEHRERLLESPKREFREISPVNNLLILNLAPCRRPHGIERFSSWYIVWVRGGYKTSIKSSLKVATKYLQVCSISTGP
jgi:hypothetical protein